MTPQTLAAQTSVSRYEVVNLSRMVAMEGRNMWVSDTEIAMLVHVILKRTALPGTSGNLVTVARAYSPPLRVCVDRDPFTSSWRCGLNLRNRRPPGFPRRLRWSRYDEQWQRIVKTVSGVLSGRISDPCIDAIHWGSPELPVNAQYIRVCPGVHGVSNFFYRVER